MSQGIERLALEFVYAANDGFHSQTMERNDDRIPSGTTFLPAVFERSGAAFSVCGGSPWGTWRGSTMHLLRTSIRQIPAGASVF
jgi:hypothetical protein